MNNTNSYFEDRNDLDESLTNIESENNKLSDGEIKNTISYYLGNARHNADILYYKFKILYIGANVLLILVILCSLIETNQKRKHEQKITQLEWALKEEKEKSKEG